MSRHALIAYYSMGGNTRRIAGELQAALGADLEEIREPHPRHGVGGMLRAAFDAAFRRRTAIQPAEHDPGDYDLVVMGGPVWAGRMANPVRTYAEQHGRHAANVAFFCTEGGSGSETAFSDLETLCQHHPESTLVVDAKHLEAPQHQADLQRFARLASGLPAP